MTNGYENDPVKEKSRKEVHKYANKYLPRDRSNATSIYLASDNNRESLGLDKLGMPKDGRLILEGDPTKVEAVKKANPGIAVLPMTTHEFFASEQAKTYAPWWYCGLDYESTLNSRVSMDLFNIATKGLIKDGGVVYTNIVAQREQKQTQGDYVGSIISNLPIEEQRILLGDNFDYEEICKEVKEDLPSDLHKKIYLDGRIIDKNLWLEQVVFESKRRVLKSLSDNQLKEFRSKAVSLKTYNSFNYSSMGLRNYVFADMNCPGASEIAQENNMLILPKDFIGYPSGESVIVMPFGRLGNQIQEISDLIDGSVGYHPEGLFLIEENARDYFSQGGIPLIPELFTQAYRLGYVVMDPAAFSYRSKKKTQMDLDIFQVRQISPSMRNLLSNLADENLSVFYTEKGPRLGEPSDLNISSHQALRKRSRKIYNGLKKQAGFLLDSFQYKIDLPHRKYLGDSSLPLLTKKRARECVIEGMSDEEISDRYHVKNWRTISALRAHKTIGDIKGKKEQKTPIKKKLAKPEDNVSRYLLGREISRHLPRGPQLRVDYFIDEVLTLMHKVKSNNIRKAFTESKLDNLIDPSIDPIKLYAFFDDVSLAISRGEKIIPTFLDTTYRTIRDSNRLTTPVHYAPKKQIKRKKILKKVSDKVKVEVRELIKSGVPKEEIWETYQGHFSSKSQFGSVMAWASPNLAKKMQHST